MLEKSQQLFDLVNRAVRVLIAIKKNPNGDELGAGLGLARTLATHFKKEIDVVADGFSVSSTLSFLPDIASVSPSLTRSPGLTLTIPHAPKISYEEKNGALVVHVTPTGPALSSEDVRIEKESYVYDLVITIGAQDLASLGALFTDHAQLFYSVPIINLDRQMGNEQFGQLHYTDSTASSCAEIALVVLADLGISYLDRDAATQLLASIIAATNNFKTPTVSPRTLETASRLMIAGANRELIVNSLFRTHTLQTLKLWGAVLGELHEESHLKFVWAVIPREAFIRAATDDTLLPDIISEIMETSPTASTVAFIYEDPKTSGVRALVIATSRIDLRQVITSRFQGDVTASRASLIFPEHTLSDAATKLTVSLRAGLEAIR